MCRRGASGASLPGTAAPWPPRAGAAPGGADGQCSGLRGEPPPGHRHGCSFPRGPPAGSGSARLPWGGCWGRGPLLLPSPTAPWGHVQLCAAALQPHDEPGEWEKAELDQAQVEQRIKEYNSQINSNLFMSLNKDGSYTGFIKVQLKLVRPVSVPATKRVPSLQPGRPGSRAQGVKRRTSFYLPKGTVKHLHILSHTRASEVIDALLRKFTVVDNPRKFALFERSEKDEQVYLRKLSDEEQPLRLRLLAGPSEKVLSFVLKENETGEVNWDAFTLPELHNFLRILQREEEEHVRQLRHRYARCRQKMQEALATRTPG
ncbi:ras association domain-containing protein 1 isoform 1-T1 [Ciconia maguari]